jgi:trans-2,3-dihydro-3-hydroxyanthranilate isomerase
VSHAYQVWDVFTDEPLLGNPLAVFGDARGIDAALMQRIAQELNLSETTFVLPSEMTGCHSRVRIFTPRRELPIAGHPIIGTTFALARQGRIGPDERSGLTLELGVGPTPIDLEWSGSMLSFAWMTQPRPSFGGVVDCEQASAALGLRADDVRTDVPAQIVSCGEPFLLIPLRDRAAVDAARYDTTAAARLSATLGASRPMFLFAMLPAGADATVYSRMFAPDFGVPEDPATGGATGPLGSYLLRHRLVDARLAADMWSLQGVAMGRASRLRMSIDGTPEDITRVRVGGGAVLLGRGELLL